MKSHIRELRRSDYDQQLARKMCAAFIAQQQGVALNTAFRKVLDPILDLWFSSCRVCARGLDAEPEANVHSASKPSENDSPLDKGPWGNRMDISGTVLEAVSIVRDFRNRARSQMAGGAKTKNLGETAGRQIWGDTIRLFA
jgi:hypothetical protein